MNRKITLDALKLNTSNTTPTNILNPPRPRPPARPANRQPAPPSRIQGPRPCPLNRPPLSPSQRLFLKCLDFRVVTQTGGSSRPPKRRLPRGLRRFLLRWYVFPSRDTLPPFQFSWVVGVEDLLLMMKTEDFNFHHKKQGLRHHSRGKRFFQMVRCVLPRRDTLSAELNHFIFITSNFKRIWFAFS